MKGLLLIESNPYVVLRYTEIIEEFVFEAVQWLMTEEIRHENTQNSELYDMIPSGTPRRAMGALGSILWKKIGR